MLSSIAEIKYMLTYRVTYPTHIVPWCGNDITLQPNYKGSSSISCWNKFGYGVRSGNYIYCFVSKKEQNKPCTEPYNKKCKKKKIR